MKGYWNTMKGILKLILIIAGALVGCVGFALLTINLIMSDLTQEFLLPNVILMALGFISLSLGLLMHAKDIKDVKEKLSKGILILAWLWIIGSCFSILGMIVMF